MGAVERSELRPCCNLDAWLWEVGRGESAEEIRVPDTGHLSWIVVQMGSIFQSQC